MKQLPDDLERGRRRMLLTEEEAKKRTAQDEFIDLFVLDVSQNASAYKEAIRAQPGLWACRIIAGLSDKEIRHMTLCLQSERKRCGLASVPQS